MTKKTRSHKSSGGSAADRTDQSQVKLLDIHPFKVVIPGSQEHLLLHLHQNDTIHEVKQAVLERPDCYFRTCISIHNERGVRLDEFSEVGSLTLSKETTVLKVVDKPYTFRDVMLHLHRFYTIVFADWNSLGLQGQANVSLTVVSQVAGMTFDERKGRSSTPETDATDYHALYADEASLVPVFHNIDFSENGSCIKTFRFSYFNPPQGQQRLSGDLVYVDLVTLEDVFYGVSCRIDGFYVNRSTKSQFDLTVLNEEQKFSTIDALLASISPMYRKKLAAIQQKMLERHPFELMPTQLQVYGWLGRKLPNSEDLFRSLELFTNNSSFEETFVCQIRDWNEELQTIQEMPHTDGSEKLIRDRFMYKIHLDMINVSRKGAIAVVDGRATSINEVEDEKLRMYLWNNMFICITCDSRDHYKDMGGDMAGHVAAALDLHGTTVLKSLGVEGLSLLGTTLVDYCGFRLVVQTVLPGIFHRSLGRTVDYGSVDHGKTVIVEPSFVPLVKEIAKKLNIDSQKIIDDKEEEFELDLSVETKGIMGTDARKYLLDLYRILPPDPLFLPIDTKLLNDDLAIEKESYAQATDIAKSKGFNFPTTFSHRLASFRVELHEYLLEFNHVNSNRAEGSSEHSCDCKDESHSHSTDDPPVEDFVDTDVQVSNEASSKIKQLKSQSEFPSLYRLALNSDCFDAKIRRPPSEETRLKECRNCLRRVSSLLVGEIIPNYVNFYERSKDRLALIDGASLSASIRSRGINVRYLGYIAHLASSSKSKVLRNLAVMEMVTRVAKRMLRYVLRQAERSQVSVAVAHFLNCFLGSNQNPKFTLSGNTHKYQKRSRTKSSPYSYRIDWKKLSPHSLWTTLLDDIRHSFGYEPPFRDISELCAWGISNRICYLRGLCTKVGLQIVCQEYDFGNKKANTFSVDDILNIFPTVKTVTPPVSKDISKRLYMATSLLCTPGGASFSDVQDHLQYVLSHLNQVLGPLTEENANCHSLLARLFSAMNDSKQAISYQLKGCILFERLFGLDHHTTILSYFYLGTYCGDNRDPKAAVAIMLRCRYLLNMASGYENFLMYEIQKCLCLTLLDCGDVVAALPISQWIIDYLGRNDRQNLVELADAHHTRAVIEFSLNNYRSAVHQERAVYNILRQLGFSEESEKVSVTRRLLNMYVKTAVQNEKMSLKSPEGNGTNPTQKKSIPR